MSAGYIIYSLDWDKFQRLIEQPNQSQLAALAKLLRDGLDEQDGEWEDGDPILEWPADVDSLAHIAAKRLALPDWYGDLSTPGKTLWEGVVVNACTSGGDIDVGFRVDNDGIGWDVIEMAWKRLGVVPNTISDVDLSCFGTRPFRYHPRAKGTKTRDQFDKEERDRRASLGALGKMLGQFLGGVKQGQTDPGALMSELKKTEAVSQEHKDMLKDLLSDEEPETSDDADDWSPMHSMHTPEEVHKILAELKSVEPAFKATKKKAARTQYHNDLMPALEKIANEGRVLFIQVDT